MTDYADDAPWMGTHDDWARFADALASSPEQRAVDESRWLRFDLNRREFGPLDTVETQGCRFIVWAWADAPPSLRWLSEHGGDEDWVLLTPPGEDCPGWAEGGRFGCCSTTEVRLPDGRLVVIGAHA